jgi:nitrate reductase cytochrome c-type subunit
MMMMMMMMMIIIIIIIVVVVIIMVCKNKSDTSNDRGKWNQLKIIQKIPEQHTQKVKQNYRKQPQWARHTYF